jgi:hypothetical protein
VRTVFDVGVLVRNRNLLNGTALRPSKIVTNVQT